MVTKINKYICKEIQYCFLYVHVTNKKTKMKNVQYHTGTGYCTLNFQKKSIVPVKKKFTSPVPYAYRMEDIFQC